MPTPLSVTRTTTSPPRCWAETSTRPPPRRVLRRVVEQVDEDLLEPRRVDEDAPARPARVHVQPVSRRRRRSACVASSAPCTATDSGTTCRRSVMARLVIRDTSEQVVDEARQGPHLPLDDAAVDLDRGRGGRVLAQQLRGVEDGREGGCAARGRAWRGTRSCAGRPRPAPPSERRRSSRSSLARSAISARSASFGAGELGRPRLDPRFEIVVRLPEGALRRLQRRRGP